jgi:phosphoadenosine phosphosulfate reductase
MNKRTFTLPEIEQLVERYGQSTPEVILSKAYEELPSLTFACSFGAEDMVLMDMIMKINPNAQIFYLDTEVLFPETYALRDQVLAQRVAPSLTQVRPALSLAEQATQYGDRLWETDPDACCKVRKVTPLTNYLQEYDGWITGIRREQSITRANANIFEWDHKFTMLKVNPLVTWTTQQVWDYIHDHHVPYNPLHDNGYPSIGCLHCTRPVQAGEDPRNGRWSGLGKTECGLHQ